MRGTVALLIALVCVPVTWAEQPVKRYGVEPDLKAYPQATPKQALASVIKAVEDKRIDYLVAQLADPEWVDAHVKDLHGGKFEPMVKETTAKMDELALKQLQRFAKDGVWDIDEKQTVVKLKDVS